MRMAILSLAFSLWVSTALPADLPEPATYGQAFYQLGAAGDLKPMPAEGVSQAGKGTGRAATIRGARSTLRFRAGELPPIVIAYTAGVVPESIARLYLLKTSGDARTVAIGQKGLSTSARQVPGRLPLKMEKYGALSYRLTPPPGLAPGEYAISNRTGSAAFTFGIDGK